MIDHLPGKALLMAVFVMSGWPVQPATADQANATDPLAAHIPVGKWEFAYRRAWEFKPLLLAQKEEGKSNSCIKEDARQHLLDWIGRKGCTIAEESVLPNGYVLKGECRLKWLPKQPIGVEVTLSWEDDKTFGMDLHTKENALMSLVEHTRASHQGACDPP